MIDVDTAKMKFGIALSVMNTCDVYLLFMHFEWGGAVLETEFIFHASDQALAGVRQVRVQHTSTDTTALHFCIDSLQRVPI